MYFGSPYSFLEAPRRYHRCIFKYY